MPPTARILVKESWYGHLRGKGDHPSLLARRYRSHGQGDELSHVEDRSYTKQRSSSFAAWRGLRALPLMGAGAVSKHDALLRVSPHPIRPARAVR
jgi:hypothetical protein